MKHPLSFLETMEEPRHESRLFPGTPSPDALEIARTPKWRDRIEYRVNQAMHGGQDALLDKGTSWPAALRSLPETLHSLFPNAHWKNSMHSSDINQEIFIQEEALLIDGGVDSRPQPPDRVTIEIQEGFRRFLFPIIDAIDEKKWDSARTALQKVGATFEEVAVPEAEGFIRTAFHHIFKKKFSDAVESANMLDALHLLRLISGLTIVDTARLEEWAPKMMESKPMQDWLISEFMRSLPTPAYADLWKECEGFGFPMDGIKERLQEKCIAEFELLLIKRDTKTFFLLIDRIVRQEVFTEIELMENARLRTQIINYAKGSIGRDNWTSDFIPFRKECVTAHLIDFEEITHHPLIINEAQRYVENYFCGGSDTVAFSKAVDHVVRTGILSREEARSLPRVLAMAESFLEKIFTENTLTDDPSKQERIYLGTVREYVEVGIGTRTYFDNVPAIKTARENINKV